MPNRSFENSAQPSQVVSLPSPSRPAIATEVRAWTLAAIVVFAHTVGVVWWAATLSADMRSMREALLNLQNHMQAQTNDHEQRLRVLETRPNRKDTQ